MLSANTQDRLAAIEGRLGEMRRRTMSSLAVTDPTSGVRHLEIAADRIQVWDTDGGLILNSSLPPRWGYDAPWVSTVAFSSSPLSSSSGVADISVFEPYATARFRPSNPRLLGGTITRVASSIGATCDTRVMYRVNGGSQVQIVDADFSTTSLVDVVNTWEYVWPGDYHNDVIDVEFQARLSGTFDPLFDFIFHSPSRLYGAKQ